jgi:hypothetical protein
VKSHRTPHEYRLEQNYPNPFIPGTNIGFELQGSGVVTLKMYDLLGREVAIQVNAMKQ